MKLRTTFRFTLPKGIGVETLQGRKVSGTMRLIHVKDLVQIERDGQVQKGTGAFYVVLLSKVITELGQHKTINRNIIEKLYPIDFAFLIDFLHEINHQVIKKTTLVCPSCTHNFVGAFTQLGEA